MSENAFYRYNPTRVLLPRLVNHSHSAAPDLFQNFVVTETRVCVAHLRFQKNVLKRLARPLTLGFNSLAEETVDARLPIKPCCRAAAWAFLKLLINLRNR